MAQDGDETQSVVESLPDAPPVKQSYRSFKKKFAKMKLKFELEMKESEALIREQLRIEDLSKRIQEQNDQLLEILLEFNDNFHIPPTLRYDLSVPGDPIFPTSSESGSMAVISDPATARSVLKEAMVEVAAGTLTPESYRSVENAVKRGKAFAPELQYTTLLRTPHTVPPPEGQQQSADNEISNNLGFLTPEHETDYCLTLDASLGDESAAVQLSRAPEKPSLAERERGLTMKNPVSVYNWLRKNQPQIFLQDNEITSEKSSSRPANLRSSKRVSGQVRKNEDIYDEDGILMEVGSTSGSTRGKRKRDEDTGYRPKGGSSRTSRKKKDDGASNGKRASKK